MLKNLVISVETSNEFISNDLWDFKSESIKSSINYIVSSLIYYNNIKDYELGTIGISCLDRITILAYSELTYKNNHILNLFIPYRYITKDFSQSTLNFYNRFKERCKIVYIDSINEYRVIGVAEGYKHSDKVNKSREYLNVNSTYVIKIGIDGKDTYNTVHYNTSDIIALGSNINLVLVNRQSIDKYIKDLYTNARSITIIYRTEIVKTVLFDILNMLLPNVELCFIKYTKESMNYIRKYIIIDYGNIIRLPAYTYLNALFNYS